LNTYQLHYIINSVNIEKHWRSSTGCTCGSNLDNKPLHLTLSRVRSARDSMAATIAQSNGTLEPLSQSTSIMPPRSGDKYRGAVVEDMQLPPAFSLPHDEKIGRAIELAYDRDFSHIPVLSSQRRPLGYIDVSALKAQWEAGKATPEDPILRYMTKFKRGRDNSYTLITPASPLLQLEQFLEDHLFALVTDSSRKFVLAVATRQDLDNFVSRRGGGF